MKELALTLKTVLLSPRIQLGKTVHYLPILFIDQLSNRVKDLMVSVTPFWTPATSRVCLPPRPCCGHSSCVSALVWVCSRLAAGRQWDPDEPVLPEPVHPRW